MTLAAGTIGKAKGDPKACSARPINRNLKGRLPMERAFNAIVRSAAASRGMRRGRASLLTLLSAVALVAQAGPAGAQEYLAKLGGTGGGPFDAPCLANQNLAGVELRAGSDVDAVRPLCAVAFGPREIDSPMVNSGWNGGAGGEYVKLLCPAHAPIVRGLDVDVESSTQHGSPIPTPIPGVSLGDIGAGSERGFHQINSVRLYCGPASPEPVEAANPAAIFDAPVSSRVAKAVQRCPGGQVAVGIHGRSGAMLDALGLICAPPRIARSSTLPGPTKALGRVHGVAPSAAAGKHDVCALAAMARARDMSSLAASFDARCLALKAQRKLGARVVTEAGKVQLPGNFRLIKLLDRSHSAVPGRPTQTICELAAIARLRHSPAAPSLEEQCRAFKAQQQDPDEPIAEVEPVEPAEPDPAANEPPPGNDG